MIGRTTTRAIFSSWWPLAASWFFMSLELPAISAVMARMALPKISLASYGSVVFPIALIIEAPIIMLLAASTALSKDKASFDKIYRFMMWAGGILTALHILIAFTPLYYPVVVGLMGIPDEIVETSRIGLMIMTPWTWTIAYRRFMQGVLIRFGHSRAVGVGTAVRLTAVITSMAICVWIDSILPDVILPGIIVGTIGIASGVTVEAIYAGLRVRPVLRGKLLAAPTVEPALTSREFYLFYWPLAMTSFLNLIVQPMGSAALSRMPLPLESLATWPVVIGFLFIWRGMGFAFNEVVVSQLDNPGALQSLGKFTRILLTFVTLGVLLVAATPLSDWWFVTLLNLDPQLTLIAKAGLWASILWPAIAVLQNFFQGVLVSGRRTTAVTEAVTIFMGFTALLLFLGTRLTFTNGLVIGVVIFQLGSVAQILWMWWRSQPVLGKVMERDAAFFAAQTAAD